MLLQNTKAPSDSEALRSALAMLHGLRGPFSPSLCSRNKSFLHALDLCSCHPSRALQPVPLAMFSLCSAHGASFPALDQATIGGYPVPCISSHWTTSSTKTIPGHSLLVPSLKSSAWPLGGTHRHLPTGGVQPRQLLCISLSSARRQAPQTPDAARLCSWLTEPHAHPI